MSNEEIIKRINSTILCLSTHPDNEPDSEVADRIDDMIEVNAFLSKKYCTCSFPITKFRTTLNEKEFCKMCELDINPNE